MRGMMGRRERRRRKRKSGVRGSDTIRCRCGEVLKSFYLLPHSITPKHIFPFITSHHIISHHIKSFYLIPSHIFSY
jgi:hypothetical protein